jgi:hypothetical protein
LTRTIIRVSAVKPANRLHAFLAGLGADGRGRTLGDILAEGDDALEYVHDYIQWLFPLTVRSGAQPNAPILTEAEIDAIRQDETALANLRRATERMLAFYQNTDAWLTRSDHNHLRITRIIASLRLLVGEAAAKAFHKAILDLHAAAGSPIDPRNLGYWQRAVEGRS